MKVTILGSSSATPVYDRHPSSQILTVNDHHYLIDCGEGTLFRLTDFKIKKNKIQAIFISHLHGDHYYGLIGLLTTMSMQERTEKIVLVSPPNLKDIISLQCQISQSQIRFPIEYVEFDDSTSRAIYEDHYIQVSTIPLQHKIVTCGFLFSKIFPDYHILKDKIIEFELTSTEIKALVDHQEISKNNQLLTLKDISESNSNTKQYAYLSDTEYTELSIPLIHKIDLLYHESTFLEKDRERAIHTKHSTAGDAAKIALKADVNKLLIGHFSARYQELDPLLQEAKSIFKNTHLATEGCTFEI